MTRFEELPDKTSDRSRTLAPDPAATEAERLWAAHMDAEFVTKDVEATMVTMVDEPSVNHVPVMTGGHGRDEVRAFYATRFIPRMPPDVETVLVARTIGRDQLIDELIFRFTHTVEMDWMLPGVAPTGRRVEVPIVVVVGIRDGKVSHERIYWDQASVLVQIGLLEPGILPVAGAETAAKVLDPSRPSNTLIEAPDRRT
jgi:carboxymethylenebutenolidase